MSDILQWRECPWTIRVLAGVGIVNALFAWTAGFSVWTAIATVITLALVLGLWRGSPGVRFYYIVVAFVLVVGYSIATVAEPRESWDDFVWSVAMLALLLAPPTHRWARQREEESEQHRTRTRL
ncbi:MAG: hypothetical protein M3279_03870 [Actinomycetota bacterium]|nr:hypothetical protein [Actinomycetota bacterium]